MAAPSPPSVAFAIRGPILTGDLDGLCERVCGVLSSTEAPVLLCEVAGVAADAVTVDALARLQLAARRRGHEVRLRHASEELRELLAYLGLSHVLPE